MFQNNNKHIQNKKESERERRKKTKPEGVVEWAIYENNGRGFEFLEQKKNSIFWEIRSS